MPPTSYSWTLVPDPTPAVPTPQQAQTSVAAINTARGLPSFLGQGLLRPFRRDQKNDFAADAGVNLVVACVGQVLGTKADSPASPGELPWRTNFGSKLHLLRHSNNADLSVGLATVYSKDALKLWEPRAQVTAVSVEPSVSQREMRVRVRFNVVDRGGRTVLQDQQAVVTVQPVS
jgi:phage baseplate assembly protein W